VLPAPSFVSSVKRGRAAPQDLWRWIGGGALNNSPNRVETQKEDCKNHLLLVPELGGAPTATAVADLKQHASRSRVRTAAAELNNTHHAALCLYLALRSACRCISTSSWLRNAYTTTAVTARGPRYNHSISGAV